MWYPFYILLIPFIHWHFYTLSECTYKGESPLFLSLFLCSVLPFRAVFLFSSCFFSCRFLDSTSVACSVSSSLIYFYSNPLPLPLTLLKLVVFLLLIRSPSAVLRSSFDHVLTISFLVDHELFDHEAQTNSNNSECHVLYCVHCESTTSLDLIQRESIRRDLLRYWCQDLD